MQLSPIHCNFHASSVKTLTPFVAALKPPVVRRTRGHPTTKKTLFFVRHGESKWNEAQEKMNLVNMLKEYDHGLSEMGRVQADSLCRDITTGADDPDVARLLSATAVYSSPLTRAIETALIGLRSHPVLKERRVLMLTKEAREVKKIGGFDTVGVVYGAERIKARVAKELGTLYEAEELVKELVGVTLDEGDAGKEWWTRPEHADSELDIEGRIGRLLATLQYAVDETIIVTGHSLLWKELFKRCGAKELDPEAQAFARCKLPNCGVAMLEVDFAQPQELLIKSIKLLFGKRLASTRHNTPSRSPPNRISPRRMPAGVRAHGHCPQENTAAHNDASAPRLDATLQDNTRTTVPTSTTANATTIVTKTLSKTSSAYVVQPEADMQHDFEIAAAMDRVSLMLFASPTVDAHTLQSSNQQPVAACVLEGFAASAKIESNVCTSIEARGDAISVTDERSKEPACAAGMGTGSDSAGGAIVFHAPVVPFAELKLNRTQSSLNRSVHAQEATEKAPAAAVEAELAVHIAPFRAVVVPSYAAAVIVSIADITDSVMELAKAAPTASARGREMQEKEAGGGFEARLQGSGVDYAATERRLPAMAPLLASLGTRSIRLKLALVDPQLVLMESSGRGTGSGTSSAVDGSVSGAPPSETVSPSRAFLLRCSVEGELAYSVHTSGVEHMEMHSSIKELQCHLLRDICDAEWLVEGKGSTEKGVGSKSGWQSLLRPVAATVTGALSHSPRGTGSTSGQGSSNGLKGDIGSASLQIVLPVVQVAVATSQLVILLSIADEWEGSTRGRSTKGGKPNETRSDTIADTIDKQQPPHEYGRQHQHQHQQTGSVSAHHVACLQSQMYQTSTTTCPARQRVQCEPSLREMSQLMRHCKLADSVSFIFSIYEYERFLGRGWGAPRQGSWPHLGNADSANNSDSEGAYTFESAAIHSRTGSVDTGSVSAPDAINARLANPNSDPRPCPQVVPPSGWAWSLPWRSGRDCVNTEQAGSTAGIVGPSHTNYTCDDEGWEYGRCWSGRYEASAFASALVRRRRWSRTCRYTNLEGLSAEQLRVLARASLANQENPTDTVAQLLPRTISFTTSCSLASADVLLVDDWVGRPLLRMQAVNAGLTYSGRLGVLHAGNAQLELSTCYYHPQAALWQPVLERIRLCARSEESLLVGDKRHFEFMLEAPKVVQINISGDMLKYASKSARSMQQVLQQHKHANCQREGGMERGRATAAATATVGATSSLNVKPNARFRSVVQADKAAKRMSRPAETAEARSFNVNNRCGVEIEVRTTDLSTRESTVHKVPIDGTCNICIKLSAGAIDASFVARENCNGNNADVDVQLGHIVSAWYGHRSIMQNVGADVTDRVRRLVQGDRLEIKPHSYNSALGIDTAPGMSKWLLVNYMRGGQVETAAVRAHQALHLTRLDLCPTPFVFGRGATENKRFAVALVGPKFASQVDVRVRGYRWLEDLSLESREHCETLLLWADTAIGDAVAWSEHKKSALQRICRREKLSTDGKPEKLCARLSKSLGWDRDRMETEIEMEGGGKPAAPKMVWAAAEENGVSSFSVSSSLVLRNRTTLPLEARLLLYNGEIAAPKSPTHRRCRPLGSPAPSGSSNERFELHPGEEVAVPLPLVTSTKGIFLRPLPPASPLGGSSRAEAVSPTKIPVSPAWHRSPASPVSPTLPSAVVGVFDWAAPVPVNQEEPFFVVLCCSPRRFSCDHLHQEPPTCFLAVQVFRTVSLGGTLDASNAQGSSSGSGREVLNGVDVVSISAPVSLTNGLPRSLRCAFESKMSEKAVLATSVESIRTGCTCPCYSFDPTALLTDMGHIGRLRLRVVESAVEKEAAHMDRHGQGACDQKDAGEAEDEDVMLSLSPPSMLSMQRSKGEARERTGKEPTERMEKGAKGKLLAAWQEQQQRQRHHGEGEEQHYDVLLRDPSSHDYASVRVQLNWASIDCAHSEGGCLRIEVHCQCWIVNHTDLDLEYGYVCKPRTVQQSKYEYMPVSKARNLVQSVKGVARKISRADLNLLRSELHILPSSKYAQQEGEMVTGGSIAGSDSESSGIGEVWMAKQAERMQERVHEEVFENQRYLALQGWLAPFLLNDRSPFSDSIGSNGGVSIAESMPEVPRGWEWEGDWELDATNDATHSVDAHGWAYAPAWHGTLFAFAKGLPVTQHIVRRRRWVRDRVREGCAKGATIADDESGGNPSASCVSPVPVTLFSALEGKGVGMRVDECQQWDYCALGTPGQQQLMPIAGLCAVRIARQYTRAAIRSVGSGSNADGGWCKPFCVSEPSSGVISVAGTSRAEVMVNVQRELGCKDNDKEEAAAAEEEEEEEEEEGWVGGGWVGGGESTAAVQQETSLIRFASHCDVSVVSARPPAGPYHISTGSIVVIAPRIIVRNMLTVPLRLRQRNSRALWSKRGDIQGIEYLRSGVNDALQPAEEVAWWWPDAEGERLIECSADVWGDAGASGAGDTASGAGRYWSGAVDPQELGSSMLRVASAGMSADMSADESARDLVLRVDVLLRGGSDSLTDDNRKDEQRHFCRGESVLVVVHSADTAANGLTPCRPLYQVRNDSGQTVVVHFPKRRHAGRRRMSEFISKLHVKLTGLPMTQRKTANRKAAERADTADSPASTTATKDEEVVTIGPRSAVSIGWDGPADPHSVALELPNFCAEGKRYPFEMDTIGVESQAKIESRDGGRLGRLEASMSMQAGGSRVLRICMPREQVMRAKSGHYTRFSSCSSKLTLKLCGIGLSLVGSSTIDAAHRHKLGRCSEFMYLFLEHCSLSISTKPLHTMLEPALVQQVQLTVGSLQVDNHVEDCLNPVMLRPTDVSPRLTSPKAESTAGKQQGWNDEMAPPVLTLSCEMVGGGDSTHLIFKYMTVLLRPLTLELDSRSLHVVLKLAQSLLMESGVVSTAMYWQEQPQRLVSSLQRHWQGASRLCTRHEDHRRTRQRHEMSIKGMTTTVMYFEMLHVQPMSFTISFCPTSKRTIDVATTAAEAGNERGDTQEDAISMGLAVLDMLQRAPELTAVPIKLKALLLEHPTATTAHFGCIISAHYKKGVLSQLGSVLGSLPMFGNPVGLFGTVSSGAYDFFHEPLEGLSKGFITGDAYEIMAGFRKGTASLTSSTVSGMFASAGGITGSVGAGVSLLAMDDRYANERARRREDERRKIFVEAARAAQKGASHSSSVLPSVSAASTSFFGGIYDGITGVVTSPVAEVMKADSVGGGAVGLVMGVGRGMAGAVVKPVVGMADAATSLFEGGQRYATHRVALTNASRHRVIRAPRAIYGLHGLIRPYSAASAEAYAALQAMGGGSTYGDNDAFVGHLVLQKRWSPDAPDESGERDVLLLTAKRCLLSQKWYIQWTNVSEISKVEGGAISAVLLEEGTSNTKLRVHCYSTHDGDDYNKMESTAAVDVVHSLLLQVWPHRRERSQGRAGADHFEKAELESWHTNDPDECLHGEGHEGESERASGGGEGGRLGKVSVMQTGVAQFLEIATGKKRELREAAARGDVQAVKRAIEGKQVDIESADGDGVTALHIACRTGHLAVVLVLLNSGANWHTVHAGSMNAVQEAMSRGHIEVALALRNWDNEHSGEEKQQRDAWHKQRKQHKQPQRREYGRREYRRIASPTWGLAMETHKSDLGQQGSSSYGHRRPSDNEMWSSILNGHSGQKHWASMREQRLVIEWAAQNSDADIALRDEGSKQVRKEKAAAGGGHMREVNDVIDNGGAGSAGGAGDGIRAADEKAKPEKAVC
jgi:broad specificity phosphatase PhoE